MTDMPDFVRRAIAAQGKVDPDEVLLRADDEEEETLLGVLTPEDVQERLDIGPVEPADHA